jgi:Na+-translocating ferredoxin:NAD+ oxidoreductase RnfG subunit
MDKIRLEKYYPVVFLTIIIVIASAFMITAERVLLAVLESQQDPATMALLQEIFPEADFYAYSTETEIYTLYDNTRNEIGYAFYGEGYGYQSTIVVLIGLQDTETIKNMVLISQNETPNYFDRLNMFHFFDQFIDLKVENCYLSSYKNPDGIDAATGATYSSKGVVDAVKNAVLEKIQYLD